MLFLIFGLVFLARDPLLDRSVALKVPRPDLPLTDVGRDDTVQFPPERADLGNLKAKARQNGGGFLWGNLQSDELFQPVVENFH